MKRNIITLLVASFFMAIVWAAVQAAPQTGNTDSATQIYMQAYDPVLGALQVNTLSRAVTAPQTGNTESATQILQSVFDPVLGALQTVDNSAEMDGRVSADYSGTPTQWQVLQFLNTTSVRNYDNLNLQHASTPSITLYNTTESDANTARNKLIFKAEQSGGESYEQAVVSINHSGSSDDQKANIVLSPSEDSTDFLVLQNAAGTPFFSADSDNGYVGIGPTAPLLPLTVSGTVVNVGLFDTDGTAGSKLAKINYNSGSFQISLPADSGLSPVVAINVNRVGNNISSIKLSASSSNAGDLTVDDDGDIGIGTIGPDRKVEVLDTDPQLRLTHTDGSVYSEIATDANGDTTITNTGDEMTINELLYYQGTYAEIYTHDNSTAMAVATGAGYTLFDQWAVNGLSNNATPDQVNNKITITKTGVYRVNGAVSMFSGTANAVLIGSAFLGGVEQNQIHFQRKIATTSDAGAAAFSGLINVSSVPVDLDFRMRHNLGGSVDITLTYANMNAEYIGE